MARRPKDARASSPTQATLRTELRAEHQERLASSKPPSSKAVTTNTTPSEKSTKMAESKQGEQPNVTVVSSAQKMVELGRVVLFTEGPYEHRIAVIVEIIDHKRALVDGPSTDLPKVPRHEASYRHMVLTNILMKKLPRGIRTGKLRKKWDAAKVEEQFKATSAYQNQQRRERRANMTDFDRFVCERLKKKRREAQRKALAQIRAEDKAKQAQA